MTSPGELNSEVERIEDAANEVPYGAADQAVRDLGSNAILASLRDTRRLIENELVATGEAGAVITTAMNPLKSDAISPLDELYMTSRSFVLLSGRVYLQDSLECLDNSATLLWARRERYEAAKRKLAELMEFLDPGNDTDRKGALEEIEQAKAHKDSAVAEMQRYRGIL